MSLNYKVIGKHIREVRQRNHLSQAMLSELVDKTPSYISYIESGIKSMSLDTFVLIANALGVSPDRLLMEQIISTERCASEEIALLLSDCSTYEMMILLDVIKSLKASLKEHQGRYGKPDNFDLPSEPEKAINRKSRALTAGRSMPVKVDIFLEQWICFWKVPDMGLPSWYNEKRKVE